MPGSGKSRAAKNLAAQLSCKCVDLDEEVERHAGKSIECIFKEDGETAFRSLEHTVLKELIPTGYGLTCKVVPPPAKGNVAIGDKGGRQVNTIPCGDINLVISLGGGTLQDPKNLELVKEQTYCIWLDTPLDEIAERLWAQGNIGTRPLLASAKTKKELLELLQSIYDTRKPAYQSAAKEVRK